MLNFKSQRSVAGVWHDPSSLASTLLVLFIDQYRSKFNPQDPDETDPLQWDPETIHQEILFDTGVELPQANLDRLLAAIQILTTDLFHRHLPSFVELCKVLSGGEAGGDCEPAEADEIAWGVIEAAMLHPPDSPFAADIVAYVVDVFGQEGITHPSSIIALNQPIDSGPNTEDGRRAVEEITDTIRHRLTMLAEQLAALPLENGDGKRAAAKLTQHFSG